MDLKLYLTFSFLIQKYWSCNSRIKNIHVSSFLKKICFVQMFNIGFGICCFFFFIKCIFLLFSLFFAYLISDFNCFGFYYTLTWWNLWQYSAPHPYFPYPTHSSVEIVFWILVISLTDKNHFISVYIRCSKWEWNPANTCSPEYESST